MYVVKTKVLISCTDSVQLSAPLFSQKQKRFSHDAAHILLLCCQVFT